MSDETRLFPDREALCRQAATELLEVLAAAVKHRGEASAVLTGGGTGTGVLTAVAELLETAEQPEAAGQAAVTAPDWTRVHLWWGDERFLPVGDPERNEVQAHRALLDRLTDPSGPVRMPAANVHPMPAATGCAPGEAADAYAAELLSRARVRNSETDRDGGGVDRRLPVFDVVLLGVGPDAHVASLFPGRPGPLAVGATVIPVTDSPKPPPQRLSLTVEALNTAERVWFVVAGADKAEAVGEVRRARDHRSTDAARWPASVVSGRMATTWWLDEAAAGN